MWSSFLFPINWSDLFLLILMCPALPLPQIQYGSLLSDHVKFQNQFHIMTTFWDPEREEAQNSHPYKMWCLLICREDKINSKFTFGETKFISSFYSHPSYCTQVISTPNLPSLFYHEFPLCSSFTLHSLSFPYLCIGSLLYSFFLPFYLFSFIAFPFSLSLPFPPSSWHR